MLALSVRGIAERKLRTALTAFAVVLGIALVSGTYLLTDTINRSFDQVFQTANEGVDVVVTPKRLFSIGQQGTTPQPLQSSTLTRVRAVPGVAEAAGTVFLPGQIFDKQGKPLTATGAPMFIYGLTAPRFDPFVYVKGHRPGASDQVVLDSFSAQRAGYRIGDTVRLAGKGAAASFRLVGIADFGQASSLGGASVAIVQTPVAQRLLQLGDSYTSIDVAARPGVTPPQLAARVREALPATAYTVRTGSQQARADANAIKDQLGFLRTFLFVFAAIALFVGAFLIVNTFSITVAQRTRELALLRMIGASRRQVLQAVIGEALVLGILASAVGLAAGFGLAPGLQALFRAFGADLPSSGTVIEARTVIVSLLVGPLVTLAAALGPALRASRVAPVSALSQAASPPSGRAARRRTPLAGALAAVGVALMCLGLFGSTSGGSAAGLIGAGAAVVFIGVGLLASHIVRPLALVVGLPLQWLRGVSGRLARENATRNPRRTASTSAALMIGVTLVAFVTIFAAGLKSSIANAVGAGLKGDLIMQSAAITQPVPAAAVGALAQVQGVRTVSAIRFSKAIAAGAGRPDVTGVDPATIGRVLKLEWVNGSAATLRTLGAGGALIAKGYADEHHLKVGQRLSLTTPTGARLRPLVRGIYEQKVSLLAAITLTNAVLGRDFNVAGEAFVMATTAPGADAEAVRARAERQLASGYPGVKVLTNQGFIDEQSSQINQLLVLFYVLLALTLLIAGFGILNTLMLAIGERTRELGMLRAIGTSRRQVRQLVRYESVITALIGAVLGVALGVVFAVLVTIPLRSEGFTISIPVVELMILLAVAAIFGVLAAIWPARRAARLDVLRALAYE